MGVFIICWLPFFVTNIIAGICPGCISNPELTFAVIFQQLTLTQIGPKVLTWLGWINSSMNPVIYACCSTEFRRYLESFIIMVAQYIPTMTKSHHGGEMSVMMKVGMCQCHIPTIHDKLQLQQLALVGCSTRPHC